VGAFVFELGPQYEEIAAEAKAVADRVAPLANVADSSSKLHPAILQALRESRLAEYVVPAEYGGRTQQVDPLAVCIIRERLMPASSAMDSLFALQGIGSYAITCGGSKEQRDRWLPTVARAEAVAALALTEPAIGSDLRGMATTVTQEGDRIRVRGVKSFISNAGIADFYTVLAREGSDFSAVLVPADSGIRVSALPDLIAPHVIGDVDFDVNLPITARLGKPGEGMALIQATLAVFRVSVAGAAVGLAQAALNEAVRHTRTREQFGKPLIRQGAVAQMLAESWAEIEMARLLTYHAAIQAREHGLDALHYSSMAKFSATEVAGRVVDRAVQVMGRFGLVSGSAIERYYRQARPMRIYEGATEVLKASVARRLEVIVP
jgi:acyl-CoA dehydrogenase